MKYEFQFLKHLLREMVYAKQEQSELRMFLISRKLSDGLFLEMARQVAKDYPEIQHNDMIIDNCCMQLVSNPHQFDVMNMANLYGSIVSNVICGLIGGAGLLSGKNFGDYVSIYQF